MFFEIFGGRSGRCFPFGGDGGKSGLRRAAAWVTPTGAEGDIRVRESATENIPPSLRVRVKRWGKSPPRER